MTYSEPDYILCTECLQKIQFGDHCIPVYVVPGLDDLRKQGYMHLYHLAPNPDAG